MLPCKQYSFRSTHLALTPMLLRFWRSRARNPTSIRTRRHSIWPTRRRPRSSAMYHHNKLLTSNFLHLSAPHKN
ncbi:hypothetical protein BDV23DRAFT_54984 [Aspergillus alliaceus]|uniref:Uncharacterized protein n=1 Tax=Petromyces alliaceus TaxID=209559 RepID=A0A5N7CE23_PETAA|nr:hypothetical protein BDV23DRAFT_54984 [Aspergillus alliaceus]